jgi:hypothetical protein
MNRREPKLMTLLDAMALSAGVALSIALVSKKWYRAWLRPEEIVDLVWRIMPFLAGAALTMGCVALARQATYRRRVRAAEWLAIVVFIGSLVYQENWESQLGFHRRIGLDKWESYGEIIDRLFCAFLEMLTLSFLGFGFFLWTFRRFLPEWSRTLVLGFMTYVALLGPLPRIADDLPNLLAPRNGFGPGTWPILHRHACLLVGLFPYGLVFSIPALACFLERIQKKVWIWSEWVSLIVSILVGFAALLLFRGENREISWAWLAERVIILVWLIGLCLVSRWIVVRVGPRFWWLIEGNQDQVSRSVVPSDASTP